MAQKEKLRGKKLLEKEIELSKYDGRDRIVSSHELAKELEKTDDSVFKIATGIASLDRILGDGVEAGELILVTGPTGEGKTTLLMTITKNMSDVNVNSVWFTLEVTPRQFLQKLVKASGAATTLPLFYIPRAGFDDLDEEYMKKFEKEHGRRYEMIDWIEDRIIEAKVKVEGDGKMLKAVFIDHIHMIFSLSQFSRNVSLEIGDMVAKVKEMAITHNLAIFLIAHSKDNSISPNAEPRKEDIRDSGLISRLADTIIGVWRIKNSDSGTEHSRPKDLDEGDNKAKIRVFKNRRNGSQGFFCVYHRDHYLTEDAFGGEFSDARSKAQQDYDDFDN